MKKLLLFIAVIIVVLSCKRDPVPKDAIPRDQFVNILVDVHIAEGIYRDRFRVKMDSIESAQLYQLVLDKYNVSEDEMFTTSIYYSRNQNEYDKIYAEVLSKISMLIEDEKEYNELIINAPDSLVSTSEK